MMAVASLSRGRLDVDARSASLSRARGKPTLWFAAWFWWRRGAARRQRADVLAGTRKITAGLAGPFKGPARHARMVS
jgi:hypothetical protein